MWLDLLTLLIGYRFRKYATMKKFSLPENPPKSLQGEEEGTCAHRV